MSIKARGNKGKNPDIEKKLSSLKEKQDKWMQERTSAKSTKANPKKGPVHSSLKEYDTSTISVRQKPVEKEVKKPDAIVWTTGNSNEYNGFVVRNGTGKSSSRQSSARTPSSKKTYNHSSLRGQSSRATSATSERFLKRTNKGPDQDLSDKECEEGDDDSLSESFSRQFCNNKVDYDFKNYNETTRQDNRNTPSGRAKGEKIKQSEANKDFMENHYCSTCNYLMVDDKHVPKMVFPCGHTFCSDCITGKKSCLSCQCEIISTQENDSLYSIIRMFKRKLEKEDLEKKEKQLRKYFDEYNNLSTRIDLMKGEATTVIDDMETITHRLIERRDTLKAIEENATEIKRQQEALEEELKSLQVERERETSTMNQLEAEYEKQEKKLQILQKTIKSIEKNKWQVKNLVEELSPSSVALLDADDE